MGERSLNEWHQYLQWGTAASGFGMMLASFFQLYWAAVMIGFPRPAGGAVALALEILLACVATAVTTIPKPKSNGAKGYYWSLWAIFAFLLMISISGNVGHALIFLSAKLESGELPVLVSEHKAVLFVVGAAIAAMVPLGGSFGLHVSGFVRAHGAGADWTDSAGSAALVDPVSTPAVRPVSAQGAVTPLKKASPAVEVTSPAPTTATIPLPRPEPQFASEATASAIVVPSEEELYAEYKQARIVGESHRFEPGGDLTGTALGERMNQSAGNGRKRKIRFESSYEAEAAEAAGHGVERTNLPSGSARAS
ncbi:hypothetical protein G3I60_05405 [Streptomyces sp. SID13666]|uniref:hypothetical protein n=1 Tax=Streptomyces sp. SID13666 TaxID=2706054 RepID=UPI0013BECA98|nr:hypothetical protein [Streptomyces sp. SID13666]NEA53608.1 hypothetical protein [Streptomyces sp. SID13666]